MAKSFEYPITATVNDMVACDQIRKEIAEGAISPSLLDGPSGVMCTKTLVFFSFDDDLNTTEVGELDSIVAGHTGEGLVSPDDLAPTSVIDLPVDLEAGASLYATDGNQGPAPVYFDGTDWRWFSDNTVVSP